MKGIKTIFVLALLLSLSIPTAFSEDTFTVEYQFNPVPVDGCGQWMIEGTILQEIPGEPLVPYYSASILLPQGTDVKDVKVNPCTPIVQKGIDLPWGQPPCTFSDEPVKVGKNEEIYGSDDIYPNKLFDIVSVQSFRGFQILCINLFPVQYKPKSGTVKFYESLTVEVKFGKKMKNKLYRGLQGDKQDVTDIVDNLEMVGTYEDGPSPVQIEEYIIVTNDTMQSTFGELANWKDKYVNGTGVYTVSWITANYTGVDNAEKVRNFIIDMYTNHGTKYVLLGGDIAAVPYRGFYVSTGGYVDSDMLADMYFAHLDGNHNADGDSRWGEPNDNVDWYAEIAVGRAPCETITEAHNFVDKVIAYEQMDKPERVCLHQSRVQSGNSPDSRCLAWGCDDWIPGGYYVDYLFEEDGTVTKTRWINAWAANPAVVAHIGHGNTNVYHINYEVGGTVSWYNSDVPSLTNTFFPWTTSVACICGEIEANDCLAEAYVKDDCGAIAAIYNDNYGWFSLLNACQYSGEFCEMEFRACWSDGYEKFGDMLNQARSYLVSSAETNSTYRWCFYERNLIGDPETPSLTWKPPPDDTVTITNPQDGQWIFGKVLITVSTTGCIDTVEFYIDSTLVFTDTAAPFEYLWDTTQYPSGQHTILVKGYCSGVFMDDDMITVITNTPPIYYVTITYPRDGQTVSGIVTVTTETNCDEVRFYLNGKLKHTDYTAPFTWDWDTTQYPSGQHTILVKGYCSGVFMDDDMITVTTNVPPIYYVTITYPRDGQTISGIVTVTTETNCDEVRFYLNGKLKHTDYTAPFTWDWDTTQYKGKKLKAEGYCSGVLVDSDQIKVKISNSSIALLSLLVFFLSAGIYRRR
ncbi:MAG: hypothetical protein HXS48_20825 [Theionarchaea archaeon]|nr:hypothetical protein [Theionarchaea archaeon]